MTRGLKDGLHRGLRVVFEAGQRVGVNVLPRHFYSATPDIAALRARKNWREPFEMTGVRGTDIAAQAAFLADAFPAALSAEISALAVHAKASAANGQGGGYGVIEADVLYAMIVRHRPRRIVQVGCGVSTAVILRAAEAAGYKAEVICAEPYPSAYLRAAQADGRIRLIAEAAEAVDRAVLTGVDAGDMLFVDSTHTVKPGSEVNRIILDVLPRLKPGVLVHFHDIYFPYDYQRGLLDAELFFNVESTLLHAFLIGNARCRIALALSMLHYAAPEAIRRAVPHYDPQGNANGLRAAGGTHFPSATYLMTTEPGFA